MKTILGKLKGQTLFLLSICIALIMFTNCSKQKYELTCDNCTMQPLPYQLIIDFPPIQAPGYLTLLKSTVLGDITNPISISWFAGMDQYPQSLQQVDTLISGNKAWFSFMFPAIYKASQYNKGPYHIRCVVSKINEGNGETLVEKTVKIMTSL